MSLLLVAHKYLSPIQDLVLGFPLMLIRILNTIRKYEKPLQVCCLSFLLKKEKSNVYMCHVLKFRLKFKI